MPISPFGALSAARSAIDMASRLIPQDPLANQDFDSVLRFGRQAHSRDPKASASASGSIDVSGSAGESVSAGEPGFSETPLESLRKRISRLLEDAGIAPTPPVNVRLSTSGELSVDPTDPRASDLEALFSESTEIRIAAEQAASPNVDLTLTFGRDS